MTDETDDTATRDAERDGRVEITVQLDHRPEFDFAFDVDDTDDVSVETLIETAKHEAAIALAEAAREYRCWETERAEVVENTG